MPLVTAVIPVYNHEKFVAESIRSVINQTYRNMELIVLNDGSKDGSHEKILPLVEECEKRFVRFQYVYRDNIGLTATLNQALSMAKGAYFTILASDDIALPAKTELLVKALETAGLEYAAAFGNALFIDEQARRIWLSQKGVVSYEKNESSYDNYLDFQTNGGRYIDYRGVEFGGFATLLGHNYLPATSNLVKTELIRHVGAWTKDNPSEDWEMWLKLSRQFRFTYVDEPMALYRWHDSNSIKGNSDRLKLCSLLLTTKEKQYCERNGLSQIWREAYASLYKAVLLDKKIAVSEKLSSLESSEILFVALYLAKRFTRKVLRAFVRAA
jgi:alpha-1,3-rhamnosyltransferase